MYYLLAIVHLSNIISYKNGQTKQTISQIVYYFNIIELQWTRHLNKVHAYFIFSFR